MRRDDEWRPGPFPDIDRGQFEAVARGLAEKFPAIDAVYLFGSRARGETRPYSDIDLAVLLVPEETNPDRVHLEPAMARYVEDELGVDTDVVLVTPDLPLPLQFEMFAVETILFARDYERAHDEACRARARYREELPRLERIYARVHARIQERANAADLP